MTWPGPDGSWRWEALCWRPEAAERAPVPPVGLWAGFDPSAHRARIDVLDGTAWAAQRRVREMEAIECLADSVSFGVLVEIVDESVAWAEALRQELVA